MKNMTLHFSKEDVGLEVDVPASGLQQSINVGDYYDTGKTGAYHFNAYFEGEKSNDLMIKLLL